MTDFDAFVAWVRTKPADEPFNYTDPENCAYAQFLIETGRAKNPNVTPDHWSEKGVKTPLDRRLDGYHFLDDEDAKTPLQAETFGGILDRLGL